MANCDKNKAFLEVTDKKTKEAVLSAIADHYGISEKEVIEEVTTEGAEHLLDYLVGEVRSAVHVLMLRRGLV